MPEPAAQRHDADQAVVRQLRQAGVLLSKPRVRVLHVMQREPNKVFSLYDVHAALVLSGTPLTLTSTYQVLHGLSHAGVLERRPCGAPQRQGGKVRHAFCLRRPETAGSDAGQGIPG